MEDSVNGVFTSETFQCHSIVSFFSWFLIQNNVMIMTDIACVRLANRVGIATDLAGVSNARARCCLPDPSKVFSQNDFERLGGIHFLYFCCCLFLYSCTMKNETKWPG